MQFERKERLRLERIVNHGNNRGNNNNEIHVSLERWDTTNQLDFQHPLWNPDAVELLTQYRVQHLRVSSANRASQTFPAALPTGPAGIYVTAEFVVSDSPTVVLPAQQSSTLPSLYYQQQFLALLRELVGTRRVLTAPLGYSMSSLWENQHNRLHRHIVVDRHSNNDHNNHTTVTVSTILTLDNSLFSTEALQSFLFPKNNHDPQDWNLMTSIGTAGDWSHWFLGGGTPQSLDEARLYHAASKDTTTSSSPRKNHGPDPQRRYSLWMDWKLRGGEHCFTNTAVAATSPRSESDEPSAGEQRATSNGCELQNQQGIQYSIRIPSPKDSKTDTASTAIHNFALDSLLPSSGGSSMLQADPLSDETWIELVGLGWNCDDDSATTRSDDETMVRFRKPLNVSQSCLTVAAAAAPADLHNNHITDDSALWKETPLLPDYWWSIESHIFRFSGQANRGAWSVVLRNHHPDCAVQVSVQQHILGVLEPVWRSLQLIVADLPLANHNDNFTTSQKEEKVLRWDQLLERDVHFFGNDEDGQVLQLLHYTLPQHSAMEISFEYEPSFLNIDQFPGDANRGFELPPVRAQFRVDWDGINPVCEQLLRDTVTSTMTHHHQDATSTTSAAVVTLFSNSVLLLAPLPDMSMPFNVISLTCTLYAFVVGSLINLLIRKANRPLKLALGNDDDDKNNADWRTRLRLRLRQRFLAVVRNVPDETEHGEDS